MSRLEDTPHLHSQVASVLRFVERTANDAQAATAAAAVQGQKLVDLERRIEDLKSAISKMEERLRPIEAAKVGGAASIAWIQRLIFAAIGCVSSVGVGLVAYLIQRSIEQ
tara:strand:- start:405 stop:734 length:330 start_codon:yes stop_codon:yes gene_type:complete